MIFVIKSSSKPNWSFKKQYQIYIKHLYLKNKFYIKMLIYF